MSQTSASEPPIMARTVAVLDTTVNHTTSQYNEREAKGRLVKISSQLVLSTSTISETSDQSSLLWTPQVLPEHIKKTNSRRNNRKKHKNGRRSLKGEPEHTTEGTSPFLSTQGQHFSKDLCSFERDYQHKSQRHSRKNSTRNSLRSSQKVKKHRELYNDYTRYQYHRRSHRDKHRKQQNSSKVKKDENQSAKNGLPRIIQRIKDFFIGKKDEKYHMAKAVREKPQFHELSRSAMKRQISGKLFRSASDSDIEVVKHHQRHDRQSARVQDDLCKNGKHWKTRQGENKLSSICESSDKVGGLERGSGSDGRLVLAKSGSTMYNDIKYKAIKHEKKQGRRKYRDETGTSEGSHSQQELSKIKGHGKRSRDYRSLKKKWAKQHQSFENDLEKLERLIELVNMKKNSGHFEQKALDDTSLLERLEAKQEKCVAEVDFTRHVLVCKLQRLENKLETNLTAIDNNNNSIEDREKGIEDIREEMSKECRDLRKLLHATSDQLRQVLEEKRQIAPGHHDKVLEHNHFEITQQECFSQHNTLNQDKQTSNGISSLSSNVPFPELSHHPLNQGHKRLGQKSCDKVDNKSKTNPTRVSTYV